MVTLIAFSAAIAVRDVLVEPDRDRLTDADDLAVAGQQVGHRQVLRASGSGRSSGGGRAAEAQRLARSACSACCSPAARWSASVRPSGLS